MNIFKHAFVRSADVNVSTLKPWMCVFVYYKVGASTMTFDLMFEVWDKSDVRALFTHNEKHARVLRNQVFV